MSVDDSDFVVGYADMPIGEILGCDPSIDRHVWPVSLDVSDLPENVRANLDTIPDFPTENASDGPPNTFKLCRCGAKRFGEP